MNRVLLPPVADVLPPPWGAVVHRLDGRTMGTTWSAQLVGPPALPLARLREGVTLELERLVAQMSTWCADSVLSRFNDGPAGSVHPWPPELLHVVSVALQVAEASGGAFDPTAGGLVNLWGFGPGARYDTPGFVPPAPAACERARAHSGWQRLRLEAGRVRQPGGLRLDLSAIAKGYAVDHIALWLRTRGIESCLVEIGGELRGHGLKPGGLPWWVAVEAPPGLPLSPLLLGAHEASVATSGDYRRAFFGPDGQRHPHTIDPRSGRPVAHGLASVTVVHADCMWADAWSTALMVVGLDEGLALADAQGLAAHFVARGRHDGVAHEAMSARLREMLA